MKTSWSILIHIVNIIFFVVLGIVTVAFFSNPSASSISPFNPKVFSLLGFLYLFWVGNYIFQIKNKYHWWILLVGIGLFVAVLLLVLLVVLPSLYS
ncbi:hypothetical protein [Alkalihalobacillus sp. LMS39]|uniref:hypothetical protein n=1 Tax=Alkalihalobacillus sp. LMS39 TaxID=2924032 RepID=UPI001FB1D766|nr:hypothetical protein [Alkalihalobacillus sp. LMS39]UOE95040.1 hypothetical protein MM271_05160 [Alkalihalobacillus sp. LMS39]